MFSPFTPRSFGSVPQRGDLSAVVLHGFTGSPSDVWPVAEALATAGVPTHVPLLRGHGDGVAGVRAATLGDWREDVRRSVGQQHALTGRPVYVAGLSMGALLAIDVALSGDIPVAGVALLSTPLSVSSVSRALAGLAHRVPALAGLTMRKSAGSDIENGAPLPGPPGLPLLAVHQFFRLVDTVNLRLARLRLPALILHAQNDHVAPIDDGYRLAATAPASPMRFVVLERGFHVITRDVQSTLVAREVVAFAQRLQIA